MIASTTTESVRDMEFACEERFNGTLIDALGASRFAAMRICRRLGPGVSDVLADIFRHAAADGKLDEVLSVLEGYCDSHAPQGSGVMEDAPLDEERTRVTLALIIQDVLGITDSLQPFRFLSRGHRYRSVS